MRTALLLPLLLAACSAPQVSALDPVTLANGQKVQGVVTVAAHPSGTAPAITMIQSFDVSESGKTVLLATETAKSAGIATAAAGALPGAAPAIIASTSRRGGDETTILAPIAASGAIAANITDNVVCLYGTPETGCVQPQDVNGSPP